MDIPKRKRDKLYSFKDRVYESEPVGPEYTAQLTDWDFRRYIATNNTGTLISPSGRFRIYTTISRSSKNYGAVLVSDNMLEHIGILYTVKFDGPLVYKSTYRREYYGDNSTEPATIGRSLFVYTQLKEQVELWAANLYAVICEIENLYFDIVETTYQDNRYFDEKDIQHDHILQVNKRGFDNFYYTHDSMFWLIVNGYNLKSENELRPNIDAGNKSALAYIDSFCNNYYKNQVIVKSKQKVAKEYFAVWPYKIVYIGKQEWKDTIIEKINKNYNIPLFYKNILLKGINSPS